MIFVGIFAILLTHFCSERKGHVPLIDKRSAIERDFGVLLRHNNVSDNAKIGTKCEVHFGFNYFFISQFVEKR